MSIMTSKRMSASLLRHAPMIAAALLIACISVVGPIEFVVAADGQIRVDLNKAEDQDGGCRLHFVLDNKNAAAFESLKLDLVMFGKDGVIARRLAVDVAPLRGQKIVVKQFDIAGIACSGIGQVLINDVLTCKAGEDKIDCIDSLVVGSRAAMSLTK